MKEKVDMILKHNITCFINRYVKTSILLFMWDTFQLRFAVTSSVWCCCDTIFKNVALTTNISVCFKWPLDLSSVTRLSRSLNHNVSFCLQSICIIGFIHVIRKTVLVYNRAVFKWLSKVITWLRLLCLVTGLKDSHQFFNEWEAKPKPIAPYTRDFSRSLSELQVIARNCGWFIMLFAPVVIGRSNCFGFGFSTVIWKPLYYSLCSCIHRWWSVSFLLLPLRINGCLPYVRTIWPDQAIRKYNTICRLACQYNPMISTHSLRIFCVSKLKMSGPIFSTVVVVVVVHPHLFVVVFLGN